MLLVSAIAEITVKSTPRPVPGLGLRVPSGGKVKDLKTRAIEDFASGYTIHRDQ